MLECLLEEISLYDDVLYGCDIELSNLATRS